jgi:hypothetical protein
MDFSNSVTQILLFLIFILVLLFINKYFFNIENKIRDVTNQNTYDSPMKYNKVRCIEQEDPLTSNNKNDLKIVNNTFKVYDETTNTNEDLVNELLPKFNEFKKPADELDAQFINNTIVYDFNKDAGKCNIKAEKTDLPIVNIKVCNLTNKSSTKLSDYI